jgi:DNA-binding XRE family transcriptional regulator
MTNLSVFLPLNLNSNDARKIYCLSRVGGVSVTCVAERIITEYLEEREIPDILNAPKLSTKDNSGLREKIGKNIAYFRNINYLSQKTLGNLVGLDQRSISLIEIGKRRLDMLEALAIAQALNINVSDILG